MFSSLISMGSRNPIQEVKGSVVIDYTILRRAVRQVVVSILVEKDMDVDPKLFLKLDALLDDTMFPATKRAVAEFNPAFKELNDFIKTNFPKKKGSRK